MTRITPRLAVLSAFALLGVAPIAHAQTFTFFPNNATINYAVNTDYSLVGFANLNDFQQGMNPTSPTVNLINGGSVGDSLEAHNSSTVNLSGGSVGSFLGAFNSSTLNIFGTGLDALLIAPNVNGFSLYSLSGTLLDGTVLTNKVLYTQNGTSAGFTLTNLGDNAVPEPGSLALLVSVGVLPLLALRRRRK